MNGPLISLDMISPSIELLLAFIVGTGFGFFLERGGVGSAKRICSVFYLKEFYVPQLMFIAIVIGCLGTISFAHLGLIDMSLITFPQTFILAHVVGGLLFGAGLVIGGYCPGTSVVAAANLNMDAFVFIFGVLGGSVLFAETEVYVEWLYEIGDLGTFTLYEWWNTKPGVVSLIVVIFAVVFISLMNKMHLWVYGNPGSSSDEA